MASSLLLRPSPHPGVFPTDLPLFRHLAAGHPAEVQIHHPHYHRRVTRLFALPAYDRRPDDRLGLYLPTVLAACCIIACNARGFLSTSRHRDPQHRVTSADSDTVLPAGSYFYHLHDDSAAEPYPVCPTFSQWVFDPAIIPASWKEACSPARLPPPEARHRQYAPSQMTVAVLDRDLSCRISGYGDGLDNAHLVPAEELAWFQVNEMREYNGDLRDVKDPKYMIHDPRNGFTCRADLHRSLDNGVFTFACKQDSLVTHFLRPTGTVGPHFHNTALHMFPGACAEFFWARFAWSILPSVSVFASTPETAIRLRSGAVISSDNREEFEKAEKPLRDLKQRLLQSSKKRKAGRTAGSAQVDDDVNCVEDEQEDQDEEAELSELSSDTQPLQTPPSNPTWPPGDDRLSPPPAHKLHHFFPDLARVGETTWSNDYSWQTAPWYPGIDGTARLKEWWRSTHPVADEPAQKRRRT